MHPLGEVVGGKGLVDIVEGSEADGVDSALDGAVPREHHDVGVGIEGATLLQEREAVQAWHEQISDNQVKAGPGEHVQRGAAVGCLGDVATRSPHDRADEPAHWRLVIHHQHAAHGHSCAHCLSIGYQSIRSIGHGGRRTAASGHRPQGGEAPAKGWPSPGSL